MKILESKPVKPTVQGVNCFTASINANLTFLNYPNTSLLWKQMGMRYVKNQTAIIGTLDPHFINYAEEMKLVSNIDIKSEMIESFDVYLEKIRELIENNRMIIGRVDPYYLSYSIHYKKGNYNHAIRIVDIKDNSILIIDDTYNFKGFVPLEEFKKASDYEYGWPEKSKVKNGFFYIDTDIFDINHNDFMSVLKMNLEALRDKELSNPDIVNGIKSISCFSDDCKKYMENKELSSSLMTSLYLILANIANSRYLFVDFLDNYSEEYDLFKVKEAYAKTAQDWKVAANMLLKGLNSRQEEMYKRMVMKLDQVASSELASLSTLENFLGTFEYEC